MNYYEWHSCPACTGPLLVLGQLGNRLHLRCRNCGMDCSLIEDEDTIPEVA